MNYQLVKQLIDAGFTYRSTVAGDNDGRHYHVDFVNPKGNSSYSMIPGEDWALDEDSLRVPTLAELIDACGKDFTKVEINTLDVNDYRWAAWSGDYVDFGDTAEEALANLYIALKNNG